MGEVMIRCPTTGKATSTGMYFKRSQFRAMPVFFSRSYCRHCRATHEWFAAHAWVCDCGLSTCHPECRQRT